MFEPIKLSQAAFVKIFHLFPCPALISTLHTGCILEVNQAFCDVLGHTPEEVKGNSAIELGIWVNQDDRDIILDQLRHTGSLRNFKTMFRRKNKTIAWVLLNVETIEVENVKFLLIAMLDISQQKDENDNK
jgi:PAS domain S-box-containing protein